MYVCHHEHSRGSVLSKPTNKWFSSQVSALFEKYLQVSALFEKYFQFSALFEKYLQVSALFEKYLHVLHIFDASLSLDIFACLARMFEFYVYGVLCLFSHGHDFKCYLENLRMLDREQVFERYRVYLVQKRGLGLRRSRHNYDILRDGCGLRIQRFCPIDQIWGFEFLKSFPHFLNSVVFWLIGFLQDEGDQRRRHPVWRPRHQ